MKKIAASLLIIVTIFALSCRSSTDPVEEISTFSRTGIDDQRYVEVLVDGTRIHFGLSDSNNIIFNGFSDPEGTKMFFSHGVDDNGVELVLVDSNADGMPNYWMIIDPSKEEIQRVKLPGISLPELDKH